MMTFFIQRCPKQIRYFGEVLLGGTLNYIFPMVHIAMATKVERYFFIFQHSC